MAVVKVLAFGGMVPAVDDRLLPDTAAAMSQNCYLYTGQLVGMVSPKFIRDMENLNYGKAYRIPKNYYDAEHIEDAYWMEFVSIDTDVVRSPTVDDQFDRYYWTSPLEFPQVNSWARITADPPLPSYRLGVPQPPTPPTIGAITGGVGAVETRSYVVTWVTAFKEEGQPSLPVSGSGKNDATWNLTLTPPLPADITNYNLDKVRIYRTQTSGGAGDFFFVTELPVTSTNFADNISNGVVSSNEIMASTDWAPPPTDLVGWVTMPNGMIAGWKGSELWFCEPYRPHAWPAVYSNVVEYPIIGLGVINQTLVICTAGYPIVATGIHPESISMSKLASFEPCMSRGSIISVPEGVFYASPNGLVLVANGVATLITEGLIQKDEWNYYNKVATLRATRMGSAYYAFGSERVGFAQMDMIQTNMVQQDDFAGSYKGVVLDNANQRVAFNTLTSEVITTNVFNDAWSGETLIIRDDKLYRLDLSDREFPRDTALWRSKVFQAVDKKNFAAMRIYFEIPPWASNVYTNQIPMMIAALTSGVTMSADSETAGFQAWKAGQGETVNTLWQSNVTNVLPQKLKVDFGQGGGFTASRYSLMNWSQNIIPRTWEFQGSTDDNVWVTLDVQAYSNVWLYGARRTFDIRPTAAYQYYRINVLTAQNAGQQAGFGGLIIASAPYGYVRVYADNRLVMTRELRTSGELMRLPSGFKADYWQIELETVIRINSVQMATSVKELMKA